MPPDKKVEEGFLSPQNAAGDDAKKERGGGGERHPLIFPPLLRTEGGKRELGRFSRLRLLLFLFPVSKLNPVFLFCLFRVCPEAESGIRIRSGEN